MTVFLADIIYVSNTVGMVKILVAKNLFCVNSGFTLRHIFEFSNLEIFHNNFHVN